ncbi:MAG: hypothetical protein ABWJ99_02740, partial [Caldimicrobium sp.]
MDGKIFFNTFLPLLIIISFLKGVFVYITSYSPLDFYSAFCLALIPLLSLNIYSFLSIFLLSLLKALETYYASLLFIVLYFLFFLSFQHLKKIFKTETKFFLFLFWGISLLLLI